MSTKSGKGLPVSPGTVAGTVIQITLSTKDIPGGSIAIFPTASPGFSSLYPHCTGIIFLLGGATSHGAIAAREHGVPAVVDTNADEIPVGVTVEINGDTGEWQVLI